jgi:enhancer of yellow 2 transcription factor
MADYQAERKLREAHLKTQINQKLEESGERERLKELLRNRLKECGWREQLKNHCREVIAIKGLNNVTVDSLVQDVTPKARAAVPDYVKKELLQNIRDYLDKNP